MVYYRYSARSTKYQIARTLLDLDWQVCLCLLPFGSPDLPPPVVALTRRLSPSASSGAVDLSDSQHRT
jgi:hypothetical protein